MQDAIQMFGQFPSNSESGEKNQVVYEELLHGKEISVLSFSDGKVHLTLPYAQIQKYAQNGDLRVKTKGMGCIAPIGLRPTIEENLKKIIHKTFEALKLNGRQIPTIL
jgi:phosphoribosylamine--glycine ligase